MAQRKEKKGRPTLYTADLATEICRRMIDGESLRQICEANGMPHESTVRLWAVEDREGFSTHYTRAREAQLDYWADEILDIADDGTNDWVERKGKDGQTFETVNADHINRSRLRIDTRKWLMSKLAPKKYGDRVTNELVGKDDGPIMMATDRDRARALAAFVAKTRAKA